MAKLTSLVLAGAAAGAIGLAALVPIATAQSTGPQPGPLAEPGMGAQLQNASGPRRPDRARMARRGVSIDFLVPKCSGRNLERVENIFDRVGSAIDLTPDQEVLYDELITVTLQAHSEFADTCTAIRDQRPGDFIERLQKRQTVAEARIAATGEILPLLENFYVSLSDDQKDAIYRLGRNWRERRHDDDGGFDFESLL
jgi:LTXXQ motif family protein